MADTAGKTDWLTIAAAGLLAMCIVTFDHEALGHGSACLLRHGRILLLTSSIFHCSATSDWIDPAGPASNLLIGALALAGARLVPRRRVTLRLLLILIAAFSWFWESAYLARAMLKRDGDLYFFARFLLGDLELWQRLVGAAVGVAVYVATARVVSSELIRLWPDARAARGAARTAWLWATAGAALAAAVNAGHDWGDIRDAVLEIGGAALALLIIPLGRRKVAEASAPAFIACNPAFIGVTVLVYLLFAATLGRGLSA